MGYDPIVVNQAANRAIRAFKKSGGAGYEEKVVLLDVVCNGVYFDKPGWANIDGSAVPFTPEVGKEYIITMTSGADSITQIAVAHEVEGFAVIGNAALIGASNDTGEGFVCTALGEQFYFVAASNLSPSDIHVKITTKTIHPIDPKFIPAFDSITLNGADGKQYKLSVDESGTLVHTAIEGA